MESKSNFITQVNDKIEMKYYFMKIPAGSKFFDRLAKRSLSQSEVIKADPSHWPIKPHIMANRWVRPLCTLHALADSAANTDAIKGWSLYLSQLIGIDKIACMVHLTAKRHGKFWCRLIRPRPDTWHSAGDGEKFLAIGQFGCLK